MKFKKLYLAIPFLLALPSCSLNVEFTDTSLSSGMQGGTPSYEVDLYSGDTFEENKYDLVSTLTFNKEESMYFVDNQDLISYVDLSSGSIQNASFNEKRFVSKNNKGICVGDGTKCYVATLTFDLSFDFSFAKIHATNYSITKPGAFNEDPTLEVDGNVDLSINEAKFIECNPRVVNDELEFNDYCFKCNSSNKLIIKVFNGRTIIDKIDLYSEK